MTWAVSRLDAVDWAQVVGDPPISRPPYEVSACLDIPLDK